MALYHVYSQTVADGTATSVVRPSDWNSAHSQVMTLAGNTVGASTISGTNIVFQGGNNVTLSINQGANVGTMVVSAANQTVQTQASGNIVGSGYTSTTQAGSTVGVTQNSNGLSAAWPPFITTYVGQTTQTQPAGNIVGAGFTSTTTAGTAVVATQNSNGLSMGVPAYLTTAAQSNHSHNFATTTTNGSQIVVGTANSAGATIGVPPFITTFTQPGATVFSNSNNVSFGLNGSTITATATFAQSAQTANLYANGNTTQLSSTAGVDVRSLSFEGAGIASVGVSAGRVLVSVPSGGGGGDGYNIVQMGTGTVDGGGTAGATFSTLSGSIYLQAGNNMTLSQTSNTINISGADVKWQLVGANTAGTTSSNLSANQFYFSGGNNVTLSGNSNTIVVSAAAGGGAAATVGGWEPFPPIGGGVAFSTLGQNSIYVQKLNPQANISFLNIERRLSGSTTQTSNATHTCAHTINYGLYALGTGTNSTRYESQATSSMYMAAFFSGTVSAGFTVSQGAASYTTTSGGTAILTVMGGFKHLYMPFTSTMTAGGAYAVMMNISSATTGGSSALRIGVQDLSIINNLTIGKIFGTTVSSTNASFIGDYGQGVYSATSAGLPSTLALSGLTNAVSQQRMYLQFDV